MKTLLFYILLKLLLLINTYRLRHSTDQCEKDHTVTLSETGRISVPTDIITLGFTIETKEMEAGVSLTKNNEISSKVNQILLNETKIPVQNITTVNYRIFPKFTSVWVESNKTYVERFEGYVVTNQIDVKISQKEIATRIIDSIVKAGVSKINYVNFDVQSEIASAAKKQILALTISEAVEKAKLIAKNSNQQIVDILSINFAEPYYASSTIANVTLAMDGTSRAGAKALYTGQKLITVTVNVVFKIKKSQ
jgi:uncharacterized protein YggE